MVLLRGFMTPLIQRGIGVHDMVEYLMLGFVASYGAMFLCVVL